jgi:hypothetical protein
MHYGEMPRVTLGSSDLRSQVAIVPFSYLFRNFVPSVTVNMTSQRCMSRSLPNYLVMTSYHWNVRQKILTWRWWMNGKIGIFTVLEKNILLNFKPIRRIWKKKRSTDKKLKSNKKTNCPKFIDIHWNKRRNKVGVIRAWRQTWRHNVAWDALCQIT